MYLVKPGKGTAMETTGNFYERTFQVPVHGVTATVSSRLPDLSLCPALTVLTHPSERSYPSATVYTCVYIICMYKDIPVEFMCVFVRVFTYNM